MNDPREQPHLRGRRQEHGEQNRNPAPARPGSPAPRGAAPQPGAARTPQPRGPIPPPPRRPGPPQAQPPTPAPVPAEPRYQPPQAWSAAPVAPDKYAPTQTPQPLPPRERRPSKPAALPAEQRSDQRPGSRPPGNRPPGQPPTSRGPEPKPAKPKRPRKRRRFISIRGVISLLLVALVAAIVAAAVGLVYFDGKLQRVNALSFSGRIAPTPGTNWLIVGTDSREGMTAAERKKLSTGPDEGGVRTDTIMLISTPTSGKTAIISIPRDLYVQIPDGWGQHKINAAFNMGGPQLLVRTVESVTGVHIDHYAEIGFGGFAGLVDSVGGIHVCLKQSLRDPKAGLRLRAGCQDINGRQALGLVRSRDFPNADLQRVMNQRKVFAALMAKATSPGILLNPWRLMPFANGVVDALRVDTDDHAWNLVALAWSLRGSPTMVTVPTGGQVWGYDGDSLAVGANTEAFFNRLARGLPIEAESTDDPTVR